MTIIINSRRILLLLLVGFIQYTMLFAYTCEIDGIYYNIWSSGDVEVTYGPAKYTGLVTIPATITYNDMTFRVNVIGASAFKDCLELTNITIGDSITKIKDSAFYGCKSLTSVTIPYSVKEIESNAFYFCENLIDVTCFSITPPTLKSYLAFYPAYYMATLHVPKRSLEAYKATDSFMWNCFIDIVGDAPNNDGNNPIETQIDKCDTNGDGEVNIADINTVIDAILSN